MSYKDYYGMSANNIISDLGSPKSYVPIDQIQATSGKNIVVIYCESLESGFLDETVFPRESQNLRKMSQNGWHLYNNYRSITGSGWTLGALYATQTGWPTIFGHDGNKVFNNIKESKIASYAGVLKKAGYENVFLTGCGLDFAGTGNMMRMFGYTTYGAESYSKDIAQTEWGVHDADMFQKAKEEYTKLQAGNKPFNLTMLTVDTHWSAGLPDERLTPYIDPAIPRGSHEYTVASLDYLLKDFVDYISQQPGYENTVVVILGDHPMMGNQDQTKIVAKLPKERKVCFMSNMPLTGYGANDAITFYDVPAIILDLAKVNSNACFSKELFPNMSDKFINDNIIPFTMINLELTTKE